MPLSEKQLADYHRDGFFIARGLWTPLEVAECRAFFDSLSEKGQPVAGVWEPDTSSADPLKRYPRVMHPHRFNELSMRMLLDQRVGDVLHQLLDDEPIATQSMFYFKPPGGKGQALHQDNYYLQVKPQSCIAAWTAIDRSHPENGGLYVCPGTHTYEVRCPRLANPDESFTTHFVKPPGGIEPVPATLEPGDVLFFNGCVVHGSRPNTSSDWRRSFICHYAPKNAKHLSGFYDSYRFDGSKYDGFTKSSEGGPCGQEFAKGWFPGDWQDAADAGLKPISGGSIPG